jgi:YgiT-type zinc finger domain-containing protein
MKLPTQTNKTQLTQPLYGYPCEHCQGTVQPRLVAREAFKHKKGFVILGNVVIGVCDQCGSRYYSAQILQTVHEIATGKRQPERTETIPVFTLASNNLALVPAG